MSICRITQPTTSSNDISITVVARQAKYNRQEELSRTNKMNDPVIRIFGNHIKVVSVQPDRLLYTTRKFLINDGIYEERFNRHNKPAVSNFPLEALIVDHAYMLVSAELDRVWYFVSATDCKTGDYFSDKLMMSHLDQKLTNLKNISKINQQ
jgi:hypothetical protein